MEVSMMYAGGVDENRKTAKENKLEFRRDPQVQYHSAAVALQAAAVPRRAASCSATARA